MAWFGDKEINWTFTEINGMDLAKSDFIKKMLLHVYQKVLFLPISDISGDDEKRLQVFNSASDRYSPKSNGFVYWTAYAMATKTRLVLDKEKEKDGSYIFKKGQQLSSEDLTGKLILDFTEYESTDLLSGYFDIMYEALNGAVKGVKASQGMIVYLEKLYESLADSKAKEIIEGQIAALSDSVRGGKTGYASGGSKVEFIKYDIDPVSKTIEFCFSSIAGHLGVPVSVVNGVGGSAMSDTGESDRKQTRKAAEFYFNSIIRPVLNSIFVQNDFSLAEEIENMTELQAAIFMLDTTTVLSEQGKKKIAAMFGLNDEDLNLG